jgi:hypothetical protein
MKLHLMLDLAHAREGIGPEDGAFIPQATTIQRNSER